MCWIVTGGTTALKGCVSSHLAMLFFFPSCVFMRLLPQRENFFCKNKLLRGDGGDTVTAYKAALGRWWAARGGTNSAEKSKAKGALPAIPSRVTAALEAGLQCRIGGDRRRERESLPEHTRMQWTNSVRGQKSCT